MYLRKRWFAVLFLPLMLGGSVAPPQPPPTVRYECSPPRGISLHAENSQMFLDSENQLFCATRAATSIGGIVWTMDGYVDPSNPGTPRILLQGTPEEFHGNGELNVWPDRYLRYVTVRVASLDPPRVGTHIVAHVVPEWNP
jgi:hypothetical protein